MQKRTESVVLGVVFAGLAVAVVAMATSAHPEIRSREARGTTCVYRVESILKDDSPMSKELGLVREDFPAGPGVDLSLGQIDLRTGEPEIAGSPRTPIKVGDRIEITVIQKP